MRANAFSFLIVSALLCDVSGCSKPGASVIPDDSLGASDHPGKRRLHERCELVNRLCYKERDLSALHTHNLQWKGIPTRDSEAALRNWREALPWQSASTGKVDFFGPFARVEWVEKQVNPPYSETYRIYWILQGDEWFLLPWSLGRAWP